MSQVRGNEPEHDHEHGHGPLLFMTSTSSSWLVPAAISINVTKSIANYLYSIKTMKGACIIITEITRNITNKRY